MTQIIF